MQKPNKTPLGFLSSVLFWTARVYDRALPSDGCKVSLLFVLKFSRHKVADCILGFNASA